MRTLCQSGTGPSADPGDGIVAPMAQSGGEPTRPPRPGPPPHPTPRERPAPREADRSPAGPDQGSSPDAPTPEEGRPRAVFLDQPAAPPRTRNDAVLWLIFAVLGFAAGEVVASIATVVAAEVAGKSNQLSAISHQTVPPEWYVISSLVGLWVGFFGAPWLASRVRGTRSLVDDLGLRFRVIDLVGLAIGVGGQLLITALYSPFIHDLKHFNAPTQRLTGGAHGGGLVVIGIFTVIGAPFFEELFFRGLVLRGLLRFLAPVRLGRSTARTVAVVASVVLDGLLFALAHAEWEQLAGLALFGVVLAVVSYRTGRQGMNMVAHASFNLVAILAVASSNGVLLAGPH